MKISNPFKKKDTPNRAQRREGINAPGLRARQQHMSKGMVEALFSRIHEQQRKHK